VGILSKKVLIIISICILLTSCSGGAAEREGALQVEKAAAGNTELRNLGFESLDLPEGYNIRQFEGLTLNFVVENNLYANILTHDSEEFSQVTGINIKIRPVDYETLVQKVNLDFIAQAGEYQIIYVDPYQTLNRFYNCLEVLNPYNENPDLPKIKGFMDDFVDSQTIVCSYFEEEKNVYAIPFDSTTMILYYRKDIFDKYRDRFMKDMGYDWTPGTREFTWERYCEVARWIDENVPDEEVKYGNGLMAQQHNSIFCEFSNILAAYGGDYFSDDKINTLGLKTYNRINVLDESFIKALDMYKKLALVSAPQSINWNWTDLARIFREGEIAMMLNWDENYTYIEDAVHSKVAGKVGYSILPYGEVRSANIYGGSGIGINKFASEDEKKAAWLYITWVTSRDMQLRVLNHQEGGCLPTRKSAYENPSASGQAYADLKHVNAVLNAWKPENIYLRPKVSNFYDVEKVLISELRNMLVSNLDSSVTARNIYEGLERIRKAE
jgi:multiple sugar transport system substrate-binding protein